MPRYFIEVSYKGTNYAGFQIQKNAVTIQSEVEIALATRFRKDFPLTGSSRTDKGVHALQNFFHFDSLEYLWRVGQDVAQSLQDKKRLLYSLNSILPNDIVIKNIFEVPVYWHSRFNAISRQYRYQVYQKKNPFLKDVAYYFPYRLDIEKLREASDIILKTHDFTTFSKRNTQVNNFICSISKSNWNIDNDLLFYTVIGNRF
ncbi:MAG: tRNA pseudouridine synthase A, partial [Ginsengibacter sp.]